MVGLENGGLYRVFEGVFENDVGRFCFTVFRPIQEGNGTKGSLFSNAEQDRLLPAGQRVSGPEVKMARRRQVVDVQILNRHIEHDPRVGQNPPRPPVRQQDGHAALFVLL